MRTYHEQLTIGGQPMPNTHAYIGATFVGDYLGIAFNDPEKWTKEYIHETIVNAWKAVKATDEVANWIAEFIIHNISVEKSMDECITIAIGSDGWLPIVHKDDATKLDQVFTRLYEELKTVEDVPEGTLSRVVELQELFSDVNEWFRLYGMKMTA